MALYRALVACFVDNGLRAEGDVFDYNGPLNTNLELVDEPDVEAKPKSRRKKSSENEVEVED